MPTFELIGKGANGRPDTLKLAALTREDAIRDANNLGFKVLDVRDAEQVVHRTNDLTAQQLAAIEHLANCKLVRKPVWTIFWGIIAAHVTMGIIYFVVTTPERIEAEKALERLREEEARAATERYEQNMRSFRGY